MTSQCTHPADQPRAVSDFDEHRDTIDGPKTWVRETVICDACGERRNIRTLLTNDTDDGPESGIHKRCPDCGGRVFTTARDGALGPHQCADV
ncbi:MULTISPECIES: hypothetical protein [Mycobacteriaceae]|uniref:Uncharacterized protein n=2 Tax=Mycobacteriaceae TaxID=1762 RepID=A0A1S1JZM4_9MYCO|nr:MULTISPECIES: hypothetical protein [Mycobacteriaceae]MBP2451983.1 DNA-directed RNA polymerase subunit RPC12/RpoP [Mycolicibacterium lutetiense]OHT97100.1 hypothetical protein BKG61_17565 [Mycobacterium syngnathidarum]OLT94310.1 hypothetical protein BKG60_18475 [Mycobacterium syngnathidarum]